MIEHTKDGFLAGQKIAREETDRWLASIKSDTSKMLAIMRRAGAPSPGRAAAPSGRAAMAQPMQAQQAQRRPAAAIESVPASRATVSPAGRGGANRLRDAAGRFAASPARPSGTDSAAASSAMQAAQATKALAETVEQQRKDAKADKRANNQPRGQDGRFGSGDRGGSDGLAGALAGSAGAAIGGAEQVDPLVGAIGEVSGIIGRVRDVAAPLGRVAGSLAGRGEKEQTGLLRRMWRELRAMRNADAKANKGTLAKLGELAKMRGGEGPGGGILGLLAGALPGIGSMVPVLGALGTTAAAATIGLKGLAKRIPVVGTVVELITGALEDRDIASDTSLSPTERREKRMANAGGTAGGIGGALAGAAIGQAVIPIPIVGAAVGAIVGGLAGRSAGKSGGGAVARATASEAPAGLGAVSARFESGSAGAGAVSSGRGDFGGASYGTHQLSSKTGTLQKYLSQSGYGAQFAGMQPGTPEFDAKWKQLAASDPKFGQDQKDFIGRTHYEPQMAHLAKAGIDLSSKGDAVKEAVWSTSVQFGGKTDLIKKALAGKDVSKMSDADTIAAIQDYKIANNSSLFKSSSANVQAGTLKRAGEEKKALLALSGQAPTTTASMAAQTPPPLAAAAVAASPTVAMIPPAPQPAIPVMPAMPPAEAPGPQRVSGGPSTGAAAPAAPAPPSQDVKDRLIAHIATGGMGGFGGIAHR